MNLSDHIPNGNQESPMAHYGPQPTYPAFSAELVEDLRKAHHAATVGPWLIMGTLGAKNIPVSSYDPYVSLLFHDRESNSTFADEDDAQLAVLARNAVPALLDELDRRQYALERWQVELDRLRALVTQLEEHKRNLRLELAKYIGWADTCHLVGEETPDDE